MKKAAQKFAQFINFGHRAGTLALCALLVIATIPLAGCSVSQVEAALNQVEPAIVDILQIVSLAEGTAVSTAPAAKIGSDIAQVEKLYSDLQAALPADKSNNQADITAAVSVLQADLASVFQLAHVRDAATQTKITTLIGYVQGFVGIALGIILPLVGAKTGVATLSPSELVDSYNKVLTVKTGNAKVDAYTAKHKIHIHSAPVRYLSLGFAK